MPFRANDHGAPPSAARPPAKAWRTVGGRLVLLGIAATWGWGCYQPAPAPAGSSVPSIVSARIRKPAPAAPAQDSAKPGEAPSSAAPSGAEPSWLPQEEPLRSWKYIVLHHTASTSGSVESIHAAHKKRKDASGRPWRGIGYHFLIGNGRGMPDGAVEATFRWNEQTAGAHAGNALYNDFGIGICLVGNFEKQPPTPRQLAAVRRLVTFLREQCGIGDAGIIRHKDVRATACPGRHFPLDRIAAGDWQVLATVGTTAGADDGTELTEF